MISANIFSVSHANKPNNSGTSGVCMFLFINAKATSPPHHGLDGRLIAGGSLGSLAAAVAMGIMAALFCRRRRKDTAPEQELGAMFDGELQEEEFEKGAGPRRFHYRDLAVATRNFSQEEKLGEGGFGSVYHGYLKDMDLHVAIKRVSKNSNQGRKEFESEVKIISRLRHRNLVELIGWCHAGEELLEVLILIFTTPKKYCHGRSGSTLLSSYS